jgi:hypothetical protein
VALGCFPPGATRSSFSPNLRRLLRIVGRLAFPLASGFTPCHPTLARSAQAKLGTTVILFRGSSGVPKPRWSCTAAAETPGVAWPLEQLPLRLGNSLADPVPAYQALEGLQAKRPLRNRTFQRRVFLKRGGRAPVSARWAWVTYSSARYWCNCLAQSSIPRLVWVGQSQPSRSNRIRKQQSNPLLLSCPLSYLPPPLFDAACCHEADEVKHGQHQGGRLRHIDQVDIAKTAALGQLSKLHGMYGHQSIKTGVGVFWHDDVHRQCMPRGL